MVSGRDLDELGLDLRADLLLQRAARPELAPRREVEDRRHDAGDRRETPLGRLVGSGQRLEQAVSKLNDYVQSYQRKLSFSVSAETGRTIIKVYDAETDELIRQIPPEETIKLAESIDSKVSSLFVQERA